MRSRGSWEKVCQFAEDRKGVERKLLGKAILFQLSSKREDISSPFSNSATRKDWQACGRRAARSRNSWRAGEFPRGAPRPFERPFHGNAASQEGMNAPMPEGFSECLVNDGENIQI